MQTVIHPHPQAPLWQSLARPSPAVAGYGRCAGASAGGHLLPAAKHYFVEPSGESAQALDDRHLRGKPDCLLNNNIKKYRSGDSTPVGQLPVQGKNL